MMQPVYNLSLHKIHGMSWCITHWAGAHDAPAEQSNKYSMWQIVLQAVLHPVVCRYDIINFTCAHMLYCYLLYITNYSLQNNQTHYK